MSSSEDLVWSAGWQLRDRIAEGTLSSVELVEASLERIEALEPTLHAFITVAGAQAREEARRADAAVAAGEPLGALHGLPVALKDEAWTAGIRSTGGSLLFDDFVPAADGAVAARLRAAGAVIVGKTNMPEFAMWPRSQSRVGGESMNPWDTTRISGASSGGSAAALAAGLVPLAIGSDGGGSIRIPASLSGVVGLFPTPGRVSARGSFSYSPYASLGPMARDVRDVATVLQAVAGYDPDDPFSVDRPVPDYLASLDGGTDGLRIAFADDYGFIPVQEGIVPLVRDAVDQLAAHGATVDELDLHLEEVTETFFTVSRGYGAFGSGPMPYVSTPEFDELRRRPGNVERLCDYTRLAILPAPPTTREVYAHAMDQRAELLRRFDEILEDHDVLITPTMHVTAPVASSGWQMPYDDAWMGTPFTGIVNLLAHTAATYPVGLLRGLPVGLHVIARPWDEGTVLKVCRTLETVKPWTSRPRGL